MQVVILAGGLGTRLQALTNGLPKPMVPVNDRPFLIYQLKVLRDQGITDVVLCIGHLGQKIRDWLADGQRFGMRIRYSDEEENLLGTAGAVKRAEPLLDDVFFLIYGDSYLVLDYRRVMSHFLRFRKLGLMVVYRNEDRYDLSNVMVEGGLVKVYDKEQRLPQMEYINFGVSILRKEALELVPPGVPYSQEQWYGELIRRNELLAYETQQRFYEIGSPQGLEEFRKLMSTHEVAR